MQTSIPLLASPPGFTFRQRATIDPSGTISLSSAFARDMSGLVKALDRGWWCNETLGSPRPWGAAVRPASQ